MSTSSYPYRELIDLDINLLQPNPLQVRSLIKSESLVDLVESIKEHGVLEPLVIAKTPAGFQIIAGERRWRASKIVGLKTVPVIVRETDARGMLEMALVENVQREQLNPIERAQGFQRLIDEFGLGATEIAKRIGKSPAYISNTLRLLSLPDAIKDGLISTEITEGHARALAGLGDVKLMVEAYKTILTEGASVRRAEDLARRIREARSMPPRGKAGERIQSVELEAIAEELSKLLKAHVLIFQSTISAKVQIVFKGDPETTNVEIKNITEKLKNISI
ncbi:hypothetical protein A3D03_06670 [Candidatus Gottesmanbacteria bacterium RIFCSPHIGHO2_02_FULL_40_13]|uniref:ParB-like N-terminal domain-containing protein n=1 Tax=Candidatus Gottesmanbacteria bacterium RIFCSPHIGHO2_02_FULL_40_13 TaxID=1798384 RepID=A0A1F6AD67_9BACT|nr:MAG: hypothetical protein A3D03_06670 [Candidatus Gottesmanbacteria bacterium RIFCSPHIGHO2_02_FULL_40_13]